MSFHAATDFRDYGDDSEQFDPNLYETNVHDRYAEFLPPEALARFPEIKPYLHIFRPVTGAEPIRDVIHKYIQNGSVHNYQVQPLFILHTVRKDERPRTCDTRKVLLWHGTKSQHVAGILEQGFQLPGRNSGNMFGAGIYFADRVTKSAHYCFERGQCVDGAIGYLFLCEVALGNSCLVERPHRDFEQAPQVRDPVGQMVRCDSVRCDGQFIPDERWNQVVDGMLVPLGPTVESMQRIVYAVLYNEYIVYTVENVRPRYLVKFQIVGG